MSESTRPTVSDWEHDFDHLDDDFIANPYPILEDLRAQCPVAKTQRYNGVTVPLNFEDISTVARDTETFSSRRNVLNEVPTDRYGFQLPPITDDPPIHADRRKILLPFFLPSAMQRWEQPIRDVCKDLLDGLQDRDECDAAVDYAQEIPGAITAMMLGVPLDDTPQFRQWIHDLLEVGPTDGATSRLTLERMSSYLLDQLQDRRANGGDDIFTYLLDQELDGSPLTDDYIVRTAVLFLIAGIDTTWSAIGHSLLHLAQNPDDLQMLVEDPSTVSTAVEEFLRAYSPVTVARITTTDTEVGGCPVAEGDWTMLNYSAANRDPAVFDDPDEVRLDRQSNRHAAFGLGVHRCIGSNLARLEMNIAIEMWVERFPQFELIRPDEVVYSHSTVRGPRRIPVKL